MQVFVEVSRSDPIPLLRRGIGDDGDDHKFTSFYIRKPTGKETSRWKTDIAANFIWISHRLDQLRRINPGEGLDVGKEYVAGVQPSVQLFLPSMGMITVPFPISLIIIRDPAALSPRTGAYTLPQMESLAPMIQKICLWAIPILVAVILHEIAHGYVAFRLGDPTAAQLGRLTLNPFAHVDLFGTVILPLLLLFGGAPFLFGYAKPGHENFMNFLNPRKGMVLVALAG